MGLGETEVCPRCGRSLADRCGRAARPNRVRYCSARCRRAPLGPIDEDLERAILILLRDRKSGTICPSEAARIVAPGAWRDLMERTRAAGRRLATCGQVEILSRGRRVPPAEADGPIRLARCRRFPR